MFRSIYPLVRAGVRVCEHVCACVFARHPKFVVLDDNLVESCSSHLRVKTLTCFYLV